MVSFFGVTVNGNHKQGGEESRRVEGTPQGGLARQDLPLAAVAAAGGLLFSG